VQTSLDIERGPLFLAAYFDYGMDQGRLLLVIHHLVVDAVSWRILLADLEVAWNQFREGLPLALAPKTSSLLSWAKALHAFADSKELQLEYAYWCEQLAVTVPPLPAAASDATGPSSCEFSLSFTDTEFLLGECNEAYRTQINELLLAALMHAYRQWSGHSTLCVYLEGHGREALFHQIDTSETVGWFTSVYPLLLSAPALPDPGQLIRIVKERYRTIPNRGLGYGVLLEIADDARLLEANSRAASSSIEFNYLGQFDQTFSNPTQFSRTPERAGESSSAANQRVAPLSITGSVLDRCLSFSCIAASNVSSVAGFSNCFKSALLLYIEHCRTINETLAFQAQHQLVLAEGDKLLAEGIVI
jgi:non-ribosomal peptide synthase protein (TIGR01720 family)